MKNIQQNVYKDESCGKQGQCKRYILAYALPSIILNNLKEGGIKKWLDFAPSVQDF